MPDLSHEACLRYWYEYIDPTIYRVVTFMDSVEDWTLDGNPQLEAAIHQLSQELDQLESVDMNILGQEDKFIQLAAQIKTSRGLQLLKTIDTAHPGSASKVLTYAEENTLSSLDASGFFLKRNITFERLRLLSRVFSPYRLKLAARALEGEE